MIKHRGCAITTFRISNTINYGYGFQGFIDSKGEIRKGLYWENLFDMYDVLHSSLHSLGEAMIVSLSNKQS